MMVQINVNLPFAQPRFNPLHEPREINPQNLPVHFPICILPSFASYPARRSAPTKNPEFPS